MIESAIAKSSFLWISIFDKFLFSLLSDENFRKEAWNILIHYLSPFQRVGSVLVFFNIRSVFKIDIEASESFFLSRVFDLF